MLWIENACFRAVAPVATVWTPRQAAPYNKT